MYLSIVSSLKMFNTSPINLETKSLLIYSHTESDNVYSHITNRDHLLWNLEFPEVYLRTKIFSIIQKIQVA